jgi:hypothetical protein
MRLASLLSLNAEGPVEAACGRGRGLTRIGSGQGYGDNVSVVVYLLLTVAIFALFSTVLKLVEWRT